MTVFDFVILAVVIVAVGFAIRRVILDKKQGKGCGGNCAGCSMNCSKRHS